MVIISRHNLQINSIVTAILLSFQVLMINSLFASFVFAEGQQQQYTNTPIILIPGLTQNVLTIVSLLIGTSSFILGLRIQNLATSTSSSSSSSIIMNKYFDLLILALVIPSVIIIIFGIILVGSNLDPGDFAYLLLLFALFIQLE